MSLRTDVGTEVHCLKSLDAEIWLNLSDDFRGVIEGQVSVLMEI